MSKKPYLTTPEGKPILCNCEHVNHCFNLDRTRNIIGTCQNTATTTTESLTLCVSCVDDKHAPYTPDGSPRKPTYPRGLNAKTAGDLTPAKTNLSKSIEPSIRTIAEVAIDMLENKTPNTDVSFAKSFIRDMAHHLSQQRARQEDAPRHLIDEEYRNRHYKAVNFEQKISFTVED